MPGLIGEKSLLVLMSYCLPMMLNVKSLDRQTAPTSGMVVCACIRRYSIDSTTCAADHQWTCVAA